MAIRKASKQGDLARLGEKVRALRRQAGDVAGAARRAAGHLRELPEPHRGQQAAAAGDAAAAGRERAGGRPGGLLVGGRHARRAGAAGGVRRSALRAQRTHQRRRARAGGRGAQRGAGGAVALPRVQEREGVDGHAGGEDARRRGRGDLAVSRSHRGGQRPHPGEDEPLPRPGGQASGWRARRGWRPTTCSAAWRSGSSGRTASR